LYVGVFPNFVLGFYPDSVIFYQEIPIALNRTQVRSGTYAYANEDRSLRAARYLSGRIDQATFLEDQMLTIWTHEAMQSSAFDGTMLSDLESGVWQYHDLIRAQLPVTKLSQAPKAGTLGDTNDAMTKV
jgi:phenylpropionate dioxygenase-like ring-hydroxylating dioxygenase large terminal subunit